MMVRERYECSDGSGCRFCGSKLIGFGVCAPGIVASIFECGHQERWLVLWDYELDRLKYRLSWENTANPPCKSSTDEDVI